jgi:hypothetical protein
MIGEQRGAVSRRYGAALGWKRHIVRRIRHEWKTTDLEVSTCERGTL